MKSSRIHREFYRNGESHRSGADVSFQDILKLFGFRTIEIGRWVTSAEQQIAANLFFDALYDLCDILQVPEQVISLRGRLGLAFGKGGRQGVCAHYTPIKHEISLAKNAGAGSLAHEWFHAFDHYIGAKMFNGIPPSAFASATYLHHQISYPHPLNEQLSNCFKHIMLAPAGNQPSDYFHRSKALDAQHQIFYYAKPEELCARAFESFVQDHPIKNAFLVQGTKTSNDASKGIYPMASHRKCINEQFTAYFSQLGHAMGHFIQK